MKNINNLHTTGKNSRNIQSKKTKGFGYQVLGFGAGAGGFVAMTATGGTITEDGDYKIHTFTSPGTFEVTAAGSDDEANTVQYLIVAGGGGMGYSYGAGGGGGGYRAAGCGPSPLQAPSIPTPVTSYPIVVGAGGAGPGTVLAPGSQGGTSSSFSLSAAGGGGGGGGNLSGGGGYGQAGGSGGGTSGGSGLITRTGGAGNTPPVSPSQGNPGSPSGVGPPASRNQLQQGGGAVAAGSGNYGPENGAPNSIDGTDRLYSTGGVTDSMVYRSNSGFGKGDAQGGNGEAGIVIIRYRLVAE